MELLFSSETIQIKREVWNKNSKKLPKLNSICTAGPLACKTKIQVQWVGHASTVTPLTTKGAWKELWLWTSQTNTSEPRTNLTVQKNSLKFWISTTKLLKLGKQSWTLWSRDVGRSRKSIVVHPLFHPSCILHRENSFTKHLCLSDFKCALYLHRWNFTCC